jgi:hypothetical protein
VIVAFAFVKLAEAQICGGMIEDFARHFRRPPDQLTPEHIREYQAYLFRERKLTAAKRTLIVEGARGFSVRERTTRVRFNEKRGSEQYQPINPCGLVRSLSTTVPRRISAVCWDSLRESSWHDGARILWDVAIAESVAVYVHEWSRLSIAIVGGVGVPEFCLTLAYG